MHDAIAAAKSSLERAQTRTLDTFAAIPDNKLTWSPSSTARHSLALMAHIGIANQFFASVIRGEKQTFTSFEELITVHRSGEPKIASREAAVDLVTSSICGVLEAMEKLTPDSLSGMADMGFAQMPMAVFIGYAQYHTVNHVAQMDYLQTIWGDMEDHS